MSREHNPFEVLFVTESIIEISEELVEKWSYCSSFLLDCFIVFELLFDCKKQIHLHPEFIFVNR